MVELVDVRNTAELFDNQHTTGGCLLAKMLSVVAVPAVTVLVFSSLMLYNVVVTHRESEVAIDELEAFYQVDQLVTNLQVRKFVHHHGGSAFVAKISNMK